MLAPAREGPSVRSSVDVLTVLERMQAARHPDDAMARAAASALRHGFGGSKACPAQHEALCLPGKAAVSRRHQMPQEIG